VDTKPIKHILLLDDDPAVLYALKLLMEAIGYAVTDFLQPLEAINYIKNHDDCELFISDLRMPTMNGLRVLEQAKKIRPNLPFVLMSAHATAEDREKANALGCLGFLAKPFSPEDLHRIVRSIQLAEAV
jgi:CheY-like chemotaxis protein